MPFIPHTPHDVQRMLDVVGIDSLQQLFDEIPPHLMVSTLDLPKALSERELVRTFTERSRDGFQGLCFLGAGAYEHHIPAAVWDIATRGEFMTAYTPYQAEASQGTLQLIYEYQSMMTALMGMDVSNASLYDGASALAEAVLMAVRSQRSGRSSRILVAGTLNPRYRRTLQTLVEAQGITLHELPFDAQTLCVDAEALAAWSEEDFCALVLPFPNFFGRLEDVHQLTDWAHGRKALVVAVVNPVAVAHLVPPGQWGQQGADIAVGDGQPLGLPLASGGPYFGFLCCRQALVRQMPGRLVGRTVDRDGRSGFTLTLQAREQHIRRAKATSNICTNQGLAVTAATIHMALLGGSGLKEVAMACMAHAEALRRHLAGLEGVSLPGHGAQFHEFVVRLPVPASRIMEPMMQAGILPGLDLGTEWPMLADCLLVCVTEMREPADLERYVRTLENVLAALRSS